MSFRTTALASWFATLGRTLAPVRRTRGNHKRGVLVGRLWGFKSIDWQREQSMTLRSAAGLGARAACARRKSRNSVVSLASPALPHPHCSDAAHPSSPPAGPHASDADQEANQDLGLLADRLSRPPPAPRGRQRRPSPRCRWGRPVLLAHCPRSFLFARRPYSTEPGPCPLAACVADSYSTRALLAACGPRLSCDGKFDSLARDVPGPTRMLTSPLVDGQRLTMADRHL